MLKRTDQFDTDNFWRFEFLLLFLTFRGGAAAAAEEPARVEPADEEAEPRPPAAVEPAESLPPRSNKLVQVLDRWLIASHVNWSGSLL